jgi:hypothetical protein
MTSYDGMFPESGFVAPKCPPSSKGLSAVSSSTAAKPIDDAFKQAVKDALIDALRQEKDLFREVFSEVLEDFALGEAIREGRDTREMSRDEVFEILQK